MKERSQLYKLDPFLDKYGFLRVQGRLTMLYSLHYRVKHPMILPKKGHVTYFVIKPCLEKAHQGRGMTVNEVRSRGFWIVGNSSVVSSHIYKCVQCRRLRGRTQVQKMANLPEYRVEQSIPFTYCGFDCFGPFIVKEGRKEVKRFGLLFTYMPSRVVHTEILGDMTTDAFINALRCFIALRGTVRLLWSDKGTNFIEAQHELARVHQLRTFPFNFRYMCLSPIYMT